MPNTLDVSAHATLWHNTEAVTFHKRGFASGSETDTEVSVAHALRRPATQRDLMAIELQATATVVVFNIPVAEMGGHEPTKGDYFEAADANYSVLLSDKVTFATRWRCVCSRQVS